jgi:tRNA-dihydrouridine synthase B
MAGVTDLVFRGLCKELGADVMVTEFVSAEGILRQDARTRRYTEFTDDQRPVGVQLFGADGKAMGEAARKIIDWKKPDFVDINFGCPVKKVVARNGGSSLLRDCPLLTEVARGVVEAVGDQVPVTAKIRIGWDLGSVNAPEVCGLLEDVGIAAVAVHGRTRSMGYSGEADWRVIGECVESVGIPVIGNGDISDGRDVERRFRESGVRGVMIGRAAMSNPWVFREAKQYLCNGEQLAPVSPATRWAFMHRHCGLAAASGRYGGELTTMRAMRSRLMAYSRGMPGGRLLRPRLSTVESLIELDDLAAEHLAWLADRGDPSGLSCNEMAGMASATRL